MLCYKQFWFYIAFYIEGFSLCIFDSPGGGEMSLFACLRVGNRTSREKKKDANSWGFARGGGGGGRWGWGVTAKLNHALHGEKWEIKNHPCLWGSLPSFAKK